MRVLIAAWLAALLLAAPAAADTWTVTDGSSDATAPCNSVTHTCQSLRAAIAAAEATKEVPDTIHVPAGTIQVNDDLVIQSEITIVGKSARTNIIDGGGKYRGFRVTASGIARISHFTVRNGAAGQGNSQDGGGILNQGGTVVLDAVRVTGSQAANGGGIANVRGNLGITRGLVDGNTASIDGGGIANIGGLETPDLSVLVVTDTTVHRNTGGRAGAGGIASRNAGSIVSILRSTVADNTGSGVGGIGLSHADRVVIGSSVVARNRVGTASSNCGDLKPIDDGANVENEKECDFDVQGAASPVAAELSNQGGEVDVLALTAASPAVDLAPLARCNEAGVTDARGLARPQGPRCDAGAFELDQAPTVTINSGPSGTINSPTASFTFSSTEPGVSFECRLTGPGQSGTFAPCDKPDAQAYSGLTSGSYQFSVRALDGAFANPPIATRSFTVVLLDTTITGGPSGLTSTATPTFTFTGVGGAAGFQCRVDTAAFTACTSPHTTATLGQGPHTFEVRALSVTGAPDPTPATRSFTVDTVAPNTTITGGPMGTVASTSAAFTFTSTEPGSTFQCSLDGAPFGACPTTYTGLGQGPHTFQVRATDPAGNTDPTPATRTWTVDTIAPNTTITAGPNGPTNDTTPQLSFSSPEAGTTFECRVDNAAFTACTSPHTTPALSDGPHTFEVRARDAAGNLDSTPAWRSFTVDTIAPDTTITSAPASPGNDSTPTFTFTSSEAGSTFQCRVDAAAFTNCTSPHTTAALGDGEHTFQVRAIDRAGNVDASPAQHTFVIDLSTPDTEITAGPGALTNDPTPTFTFVGGNGATAFQCRVDTAAFTACTSPFTTPPLGDGEHTVVIRALNAAGTPDASPASVTFVVDTTPPAPPAVVSGPQGPTTDPAPAFTFTAAERVTCRLDGPGGRAGTFGACRSPVSFGTLAPGEYVFIVRSVDAAGNASETRRAFAVTVPQQATPTPAPPVTPAQDPAPAPTPDAGNAVVTPATGTILIRRKGSRTFEPLTAGAAIPYGSEIDARKGRVTLTSLPRAGAAPETADFFAGLFTIHKVGQFTELRLSEKLTGCKKAKRASAAQKKRKPKTRKLWGDGKGKFRTKGQYSSATIRGTRWLVQDGCTTTLTRVTQGVVAVRDFGKRKTVLVKKGKRYTARAKRR